MARQKLLDTLQDRDADKDTYKTTGKETDKGMVGLNFAMPDYQSSSSLFSEIHISPNPLSRRQQHLKVTEEENLRIIPWSKTAMSVELISRIPQFKPIDVDLKTVKR